jgi:hypothetical protein
MARWPQLSWSYRTHRRSGAATLGDTAEPYNNSCGIRRQLVNRQPAISLHSLPPASSRQNYSSHHYLGVPSAPATNHLAPHPDRSFTPTHPTALGRKPIAATSTTQHRKPFPVKIPMAPAAPPPRNFAPWRFFRRRTPQYAEGFRHAGVNNTDRSQKSQAA